MTDTAAPDAATSAPPRATMPRLSVMIPAYVRPRDLVHTLEELRKQDLSEAEILVVDDCTPDSSIADAVKPFPEVRYVRTPRNLGLIGARNFGGRQCRGEYVLNLDDDSWPVDPDALPRILRFMDDHPDVGVAALNIGLADTGYRWPDAAPVQPVRYYTGCGNVYRRRVVGEVGDYVEAFFRQGEELDRTLRVMDHGYRVVALPSIRVFHSQSPVNRNMAKHLAFEAANYLRRELIRAPLPLVPLGVARAARFTARHWRAMDRAAYRQEVFGKRAPLLRFVREHRRPVRIRTYLSWLALR